MARVPLAAVLVLTILAAPQAPAGEPAIPYPKALDAAAIAVPTLESIHDHALILGNGDINALLYSEGGNLVLRLTKNDVWDARLDTSNDPPLLPMARIRELAKGDWPKGGSFGGGWLNPDGSVHRGANSWSKPYPCPRACALVRLGSHPARPAWRRIRAQGRHNAWERKGDATVMSIQGKKGASNGYAFGPLGLSTADYPTLRVKLSGTGNARFFVDVMGKGNTVLFGSKWIETPTETEERTFKLPAGRQIERLILYTWTEDGKRAENRFEAVTLEGPKGKRPIDLTVIAPPSSAARLDVRRAVADVAGMPDGVPKAVVRALAGRNVFLIESNAQASLAPITSSHIPAATMGERDGATWLHQKFPADPDWPGMDFAVAVAAQGERKAVAIVTSFESKDVVAAALALARATAEGDPSALVERHEAAWRRFWAASGVDVGEPMLRAAWYRNLYFMRCVARPGAACVGG